MTTIALQGDFATPETLRRDVGDLASSIDVFWDTKRNLSELSEFIRGLPDAVNLMGYSRGSIVTHELICGGWVALRQVRRVVIYEGPTNSCRVVPGFFSVCICWNNQSKPLRWRKREATELSWSWQHRITPLMGSGRHVRRVPGGTPPLGHNWDWSLNDDIREFLR